MGPAYRTGAGMMICLFFAIALMILSILRCSTAQYSTVQYSTVQYMILSILSYYFNSWFQLALVTSVPFTLLFSYW